ncbi:MAG: MarR family transcriptional regulator [Novosphingobium lindaniclasticum]|jgi:DNA-binding MarR family transcriptional regulator|nr:MarR family transcriptional regulator [Novosphingobium lindaniclasticum]
MSSIAIQSRAIYIEEMSQSPSSTPEIDLDPFEDFLCFSVYSTGLAFNRIYKPLLDRLGLTYLQYLAILALARQDDQAVSELGEKLFLESNTLTPLLKRLEAAGLVERRRSAVDERVVRITLTDKGRETAEQARCVPAELLETTGIAVEELEALNGAIKKLRGQLRGK